MRRVNCMNDPADAGGWGAGLDYCCFRCARAVLVPQPLVFQPHSECAGVFAIVLIDGMGWMDL